ncbi:YaaA family protein [Leucobacter sp. GX24907]
MRVLLPPSETKRIGGSRMLNLTTLSAHQELGDARAVVIEALTTLSSDTERAVKALGLGVKNRDELAYNLELHRSGVMPAAERYTGVLYDAIGVESLASEERGWLDEHVSVQSALFGLISAGDLIPAYRLSAGTSLPALGTSLKRFWRDAHAGLCPEEHTFVLDLRSQGYAELAPMPGAVQLQVATLESDGSTRALNHFNKAAKGDLVRRLAVSEADIESAGEFLAWGEEHGLALRDATEGARMTLLTDIGAPAPTRAR